MKLVHILAKELGEWPERTTGYFQEETGIILAIEAGEPKFKVSFSSWDVSPSSVVMAYKADLYGAQFELASDYKKSIVTREMWQAERERIAKTGKKANAEGWIRHRGGKCPVETGVMADVRNRAGDISTGRVDCTSVSWHWSHDKHPGDIMAYRIHKPAERPFDPEKAEKDAVEAGAVITVEADIDFPSGVIHIDGPLQWRDRIREIDRTVEALEEERVSLIQRLEGEGFKLIDQVNAKIAEAKKAHDDMSDPSKWRKGDFVECITDHSPGRQFSKGLVYELRSDYDGGSVKVVSDDKGSRSNGMMPEHFKFHSRPSA